MVMKRRSELTLASARDQHCLERFIQDHEGISEAHNVRERFMRLLDAMARSSQSGKRTSKREPSED